jgi:hypothetical protein
MTCRSVTGSFASLDLLRKLHKTVIKDIGSADGQFIYLPAAHSSANEAREVLSGMKSGHSLRPILTAEIPSRPRITVLVLGIPMASSQLSTYMPYLSECMQCPAVELHSRYLCDQAPALGRIPAPCPSFEDLEVFSNFIETCIHFQSLWSRAGGCLLPIGTRYCLTLTTSATFYLSNLSRPY